MESTTTNKPAKEQFFTLEACKIDGPKKGVVLENLAQLLLPPAADSAPGRMWLSAPRRDPLASLHAQQGSAALRPRTRVQRRLAGVRVAVAGHERGPKHSALQPSHGGRGFLKDHRIVSSMSEVGHCSDNAAAAGLPRQAQTRADLLEEARADVFNYIERFHNALIQRRLDAKDQAFRLLTQSS